VDAQPDDAQSGGASKDPRLIKRYANRKLYDTRDSRYVTLQQIAEFVRRGEDVRIIDNKSKEDLTNVTLAQIIYEEEKKGESTTRRTSLRSFIQEGRARLMETLPGPISKLLAEEEGAEGAVLEGAEEAGEAKEGAPAKKGPIDGLKGLADQQVKAILQTAMGRLTMLQAEVKRLQDRIEELEQKISKNGKK